MAKYKCPKCGSPKVYGEASFLGKLDKNNNDNPYNVDIDYVDNYFTEYLYCEDCGWGGDWATFEIKE